MEQLTGLRYKILVITVVLFVCQMSFAQDNNFGKNLKGKVKKMTSIFYFEDLENGTGFNKDAERVVWYDEKGNDSLMLFKSKHDDFKPRKTSYFYSIEDQLDSIVEFDVNGNKKTIFIYEYDALNRMIKQQEFTCKNKSYADTYYEYNAEGLMVKELVNLDDSDELFYSFSYKYENKNVIELSSSLSTKSSTFKYNEHNDRVFYENTVGVTFYEYEYDEFKNWVKRTDWVLNKGLQDSHPSIERIIEYY
jgi:hypothetical protein